MEVADQALLSDCQGSALVDRDGVVSWWAAPRFDSASIFTQLLDADAGRWRISPADPFETERRYRDDTMVLETTMRTENGMLRLTDALLFAHGSRGHGIGLGAPCALARVAEVLDGEVEVVVEIVPRLEYGLAVPRVVETGDGGVATIGGEERIFVNGDKPLRAGTSRADARLRLRAGERAGWVAQRAAGAMAQAPPPLDPHAAIADTTTGWRSWSEKHKRYSGEHAEAVNFAGRVIQALTYQPSGAVVAAATTSLPEIPGGDANWDYRFGWLRDAAMIARALSIAACNDESRRYFAWMVRAGLSCVKADHIQIVFGVEGERHLAEHELGHLGGHGGARPVRVGNQAWCQRQLDVLGHVLDCAWVLRDQIELDDPTVSGFLCQLAARAAAEWRKPDAGIWESREGELHYTVSKLCCWVALDRAVKLGERLGAAADPAGWSEERDAVRAAILEQAWCEELGAYGGALGSDQLDAGVLLMLLVDFLEPDDERMTSTIDVIERDLGQDGLLQRWSGASDGAFLLASFWLAECHARAGRLDRARSVFARAAGAANDLGLLAEEADLPTGAPLGNVPQAISHVGLVTAAVAIDQAQRHAAT